MENNLNLTPEQLEQAKSATSAAALLAFAQENDIALTAEEAALYFAQLHPKEGALSDEELDNVSGGCGESKDPLKLAIKYAHQTYCGKHSKCFARRTENGEEQNFYMTSLGREGKLCFCCYCKPSIDAYCKSKGWPTFERSTTRYRS